jgi:hypothetical protein
MHDETTLMPNSFNAGECVSLVEASISDIICPIPGMLANACCQIHSLLEASRT